jgi:hypothetical protein
MVPSTAAAAASLVVDASCGARAMVALHGCNLEGTQDIYKSDAAISMREEAAHRQGVQAIS